MQLLKRLANNEELDSLATRIRRRRFAIFLGLLARLPRPVRILDVGGTERFWETMRFAESAEVRVTLLNITPPRVRRPNFSALAGDARQMGQFADNTFDVVFSNSVIEHVGSLENQRRMAGEIMRVGRRYFVQTPSRFFPIEPHFLYPYFQFWPIGLRTRMLSSFDVGWWKRIPDPVAARAELESIRLLTAGELRALFPGAVLYRERLLGMTKSYVVYGGWET